jgi:hypothetical protein
LVFWVFFVCLRFLKPVVGRDEVEQALSDSRERARNLRVQAASPTYADEPPYLSSFHLLDRLVDRPPTSAASSSAASLSLTNAQVLHALMRPPRSASRYDASGGLSMAELGSLRQSMAASGFTQGSSRAGGWSGDEGSDSGVLANSSSKAADRRTPSPAASLENAKERSQKSSSSSAKNSPSGNKQAAAKRTSAETEKTMSSAAASSAATPTKSAAAAPASPIPILPKPTEQTRGSEKPSPASVTAAAAQLPAASQVDPTTTSVADGAPKRVRDTSVETETSADDAATADGEHLSKRTRTDGDHDAPQTEATV